ncbi:DUF2970 domain-containing protein [Nitrococcus mobilis]|uniref:DUF2970 domain-containing protein n=1 Tax=Nitrococcus mobilis Nb-231 TaxID=314278 RepID=A4BRI3_9GAMM|nr:DUF2970 domain-containing protein [Nitrococcus mobilis]EAR21554.1 hypothetical protein NB231_02268 [Nitrococcus mobilis Nb-231]
MSAHTQRQAAAAKQKKVSTWQVIKSTAAAGFGVQSKAAMRRDFTYGRPLPFIIAGAVGTILFILAIVMIVRAILHIVGA